ncbi:MAG: electron transfer flavoprotein beta subunit/FixA family protein [Gracilibacteraceae bacterium]|jgi:electron transfer flavoprotein beta subunit|nr:electron transfer flavoprotein beta subunit/FixA family protein [Gracilibacteraceae bacterium]
MPNVIVCYKWVLDEQDISVNENTLELNLSRAKSKISDYDRNAIEAGARLVERFGGKLTALSYGTSDVKSSLKDTLSRGPEAVYWIGDATATKADAYVTANVLAAAIKQIGSFDIVICAEGSADQYSQQVGPRLAALLGAAAVTFANQLDWADGQLVAHRKLENSIEVLRTDAPVVASVLPEINEARIPALKQVLAAGKKPMTELKISDLQLDAAKLQPKNKVDKIKGAVFNRKNIIFKESNAAENVSKLLDCLKKESVV